MLGMSKQSPDRDAILWGKVLDVLRDGRWHPRSSLTAGAGWVAERALRRFRYMGAPLQFDLARGVRLRYALTPLVSRRRYPVRTEARFALDSTNAELLRGMGKGASSARALLAEHQTHGRGRRERTWQTPLGGGVAMSLALSRQQADQVAALPLAAGVALASSLRRLGLRGVGLKWPNDLMVGGRKLGGVLVEARPTGVVIGVGLNHRLPPGWLKAVGQPVTSLAVEMGTRLPARDRAVQCMLEALMSLAQGGQAGWRQEFARYDMLAGRGVRVQEATGDVWEGVAAGVDIDGALRVRTATGERLCHAGDVSVRVRT